MPARARDKLEGDEVWSFGGKKTQKRGLWTALGRRTRQSVAFVLGDPSARTCRQLGRRIPPADKRGRSFSELWESYRQVFPRKTPRRVGKGNGEINHMERWNNTLRQRKARSVRRTLAFAKSDFSHELVTRLFILRYNLVRRSCVI